MLLTVDELREQVVTALPDDALQRLLDAAEADITAWTWPVGQPVREVVHGSRFLTLDYRAEAIVSVGQATTDGTPPTPIDPLTYALTAGGYVIALTGAPTVYGGTSYGYDYVVDYTPIDNTAARKRVQVALVKDDIAYEGMQSQGLGDWSGTFGTKGLTVRRREHLASLVEPQMAVVG